MKSSSKQHYVCGRVRNALYENNRRKEGEVRKTREVRTNNRGTRREKYGTYILLFTARFHY